MADNKLKVAVVGASGYGGAELVRLLATHPRAVVTVVTSGRSAGKPLREECPWLNTDLVLSAFDPATVEADFVFLCQETGFAMDHAKTLIERTRVIDLSADFRLKDVDVYRRYYAREHSAVDLLPTAVYGLPELVNRADIAAAKLVANPGCYPTACGLAIAPIARADMLGGTPVVDAKSGVSGAGRSKKDTDYLFSELNGSFKAYGVQGHRHTPEVEWAAGRAVRFTPHLLPVARGIEATAYLPLSKESSKSELTDLLTEFYKDVPCVTVQTAPPSTKQVLGSNRCVLSAEYDPSTGFAIICSVIDNLVKGAAGQAIQNMNLMAGLPEETGLPLNGMWP